MVRRKAAIGLFWVTLVVLANHPSNGFSSEIFEAYRRKDAEKYIAKKNDPQLKIEVVPTEMIVWRGLVGPYRSTRSAEKVITTLKKKGQKATLTRMGEKIYITPGSFLSQRQLFTVMNRWKSLGLKSRWRIFKAKRKIKKYVVKPATDSESKEVFTFGEPTPVQAQTQSPKEEPSNFELSGSAWLESSYAPKTYHGTNNFHFGRFVLDTKYRPSTSLEMRSAWMADAMAESHNIFGRLEPLDNFVQYKKETYRITLGLQTVLWGRVYENSPIDRVSVVDLTRLIIDPLADRRLPQGLFRIEWESNDLKVDGLFIPYVRRPKLPHIDSYWSLIDATNGEMMGIEAEEPITTVIQSGIIDQGKDGQSGGGLRVTGVQNSFDWGISWISMPDNLPYYQVNTDVIAKILLGQTPQDAIQTTTGPHIFSEYPIIQTYGLELGAEFWQSNWRMEVAYSQGRSATNTNFSYTNVNGLDWVLSFEAFPTANGQLNLQLGGNHLLTNQTLYDFKDIYSVSGQYSEEFFASRWRAGLRFNRDFNRYNNYVSPFVTYVGLEPSEFRLAFHLFNGEPRTLGGFYADRSLISLSWRKPF